jgi:hypothetical protein
VPHPSNERGSTTGLRAWWRSRCAMHVALLGSPAVMRRSLTVLVVATTAALASVGSAQADGPVTPAAPGCINGLAYEVCFNDPESSDDFYALSAPGYRQARCAGPRSVHHEFMILDAHIGGAIRHVVFTGRTTSPNSFSAVYTPAAGALRKAAAPTALTRPAARRPVWESVRRRVRLRA